MEQKPDPQAPIESKSQLVEQVNKLLKSAEYSRALGLLRSSGSDFPKDEELSGLEKVAQDGVQRKAEADRLITESQGLFAQQKPADAIQRLRQAYELDQKNSLARTILANALVEHAISLVETDWWESAMLAKQALELNPAHPTAKTIRSLIRDQKKAGTVEQWISQVSRLQSSGDLPAALSLIAEGLAVHPRDPKLLLMQDAIHRDQDARHRQARRRDLEDLRQMESEIDGGANAAAKEEWAKRIQAVANAYLTDGEILTVTNRLLHRLELAGVSEAIKAPAPDREGATVAHSAPAVDASGTDAAEAGTSKSPPTSVPRAQVPARAALSTAAEPQPPAVPAGRVSAAESSGTPTKAAAPSLLLEQPSRSKATTLILISAAAVILVAATFFVTRRHYAPPVASSPSSSPAAAASAAPAPAAPVPAPAESASAQASPEPSSLDTHAPSEPDTAKVAIEDRPPADSSRNVGTLLVVAGQDGARVFLNGKAQPQLTQSGQLRLPNLELKDYVVRVSKSGFQDSASQRIRVRKGEEAKLVFNLQPQPQPPSKPRSASLTIQGGAPGTAVLVDQGPMGTIQPDGTFSVSNVSPGDHTVELRKERFKPRQLKKHFVAGETVLLAAADAALETAPSELKITFTPADANVAVVKGGLLKMVSSGVPLSLEPGTYTLTARTAERVTRSATLEVIAGQSKSVNLFLAPNGMTKWEDPGGWKQEKDTFTRKGGDFVLYGVVPAAGTFVFSATPAKGRVLQWVLNFVDSRNYVLLQIDDNNFHRSVIRNGQKADEIMVPHKGEKKGIRQLQIRVSSTEIVHQIKNGDSWTVLDRWTQPGTNLSLGKFGFYIPGNDQVALSGFAHYPDLNIR